MFWTLVGQEVLALPRARFGPMAAAMWLATVTLLVSMVLGAEANALYSVLVVLFVLPALALLPITAGYVSSDRSTRFVQGVFTTPIRPSEYLFAKLAPPVVLAIAYCIAILPFLAVFAYLTPLPRLIPQMVAMSATLAFACIAVGALLGILFTGRSQAAAIAAGTAFAVFSGASVLFLPVASRVQGVTQRELLMAALHASPLTLALDAWDLHGFAGTDSTLASTLGLGILTFGAVATALWIYTRQQAPETWEPTRWGRVAVPLSMILVLVVPAALAAPNYEPRPPTATVSYGNPNVTVLFVPPGTKLSDLTGGFRNPNPTGEWRHLDLLLLFRANVSLPIAGLTIETVGPQAEFRNAGPLNVTRAEHHLMDDGRLREVVRLPADVKFEKAGALGRSALIVPFLLTWTDPHGNHAETGDQLVWVHTPDASQHLAFAGAPAILICIGSYATRRWKLR